MTKALGILAGSFSNTLVILFKIPVEHEHPPTLLFKVEVFY